MSANLIGHISRVHDFKSSTAVQRCSRGIILRLDLADVGAARYQEATFLTSVHGTQQLAQQREGSGLLLVVISCPSLGYDSWVAAVEYFEGQQ